jgi:hypothetical protein
MAVIFNFYSVFYLVFHYRQSQFPGRLAQLILILLGFCPFSEIILAYKTVAAAISQYPLYAADLFFTA